MAVTAKWYANAFLKMLAKEISWSSDTIKVALTTSSYSPSQATHDYFDDVTDEVTGAGYTAGGATLASKTIAYAASSTLTAWAANTAYVVGDVVRKTADNGHCYRCIIAGTSHAATEPTWPTVTGQVVTDNTATWAEYGAGIVKLDATDTSWTNSTITARIAVIYVATGTASTSALLGYVDFGADKTTTDGTFLLTWDGDGIFTFGVP